MRLAVVTLLGIVLAVAACGGGSVGPRDTLEADSGLGETRDTADTTGLDAHADLGPEPKPEAPTDVPDETEPEPEPQPEDGEVVDDSGPPPDGSFDVPEIEVEACACALDADCAAPVLPCRQVRCLACACVDFEVDEGPCTDADPCTTDDACVAGVCLGAPLPCSDQNPCTDDSCGPDGACLHASIQGPCSDDNACTVDDTCLDGVCVPGEALVRRSLGEGGCEDANPCTSDGCDPATGCTFAPVPGPCSDDSLCTRDDACFDGVCQGTSVSCDDGNACTADGCSPATGCSHSPLDEGPCDDGSVCTLGDHCSGGVCQGSPLSCDDANVCTSDLCDPVLGCLNPGRPGLCDDGSACTRDDACLDSLCVGAPLPCDDGDPCTDDACEESLGCVYGQNEAPCDDQSPCTSDDRCVSGRCRGAPLVCSEQRPSVCIAGGTAMLAYLSPGACVAGQCVYTASQHACPAGCAGGVCLGDPCVGVACDDPPSTCLAPGTCVAGGCRYAFADAAGCDDGNACTGDDACEQGVCFGVPRWCDDPPPAVCLDPATRRIWLTGGSCDPADGACAYASSDETCSSGCVEGTCLLAPSLAEAALTAFGAAGLESMLYELRGVSTPWIDGQGMSSATWNLTMGFEP